MPRLSHTFDITRVEREVVTRTVAAAHEVVRSCRFDGRGWLLTPDEATLDRLEKRADELGLVDREETGRRRRGRRAAPTSLREGTDATPGNADEHTTEESKETTTALQLRSGRHLATRSHYLVAELTADGVPQEPEYEAQGWTSTGLTVTAWDEEGTSSLEFAMPDAVGADETPVTSGTASHDARTGVLTMAVGVRLPGRGAWLRSARGTLTVDTGAWYAALEGRSEVPPARLGATHAVARVDAWLSPSPRPDGRWDVEAVLDVRGRGPYRPFVAMVVWALRRSVRMEERRALKGDGPEAATLREQLEQARRSWDRIARNAPRLPEFLHDVARAMAAAQPRG